jgi:hypothetical protein
MVGFSEFICPLIAIVAPETKYIVGINISKERNMLVASRDFYMIYKST